MKVDEQSTTAPTGGVLNQSVLGGSALKHSVSSGDELLNAPQGRRKKRPPIITLFAGSLLLVFLFFAISPSAVTSQDPVKQDLRNRLAPPVWSADGTWTHPLGTDHLGRDLWARIIYGTRVTILIAGGAVLIAGFLGTALGLLAGFSGGWLDEGIMRIADIQLSFSPILLVIAIMAVIGPGIANVILVLGVVSWVQYARVVRGETLLLKETPYVEAAHSIGLRRRGIMLKHILPNVLPSLLVIGAVNCSQQILNEAALSFLGLGVKPPTPAWGSMLAEGQSYFQVAWWNAFFPGIAILLIVLAVNLLGDRLADLR